MIRVLFVCLGNICRSPLAEGIFDHRVKNLSLEPPIESDSCGTSDWHLGQDPDPRSIEIANIYGIQLRHQGRQIDPRDFEQFDYILAMDRENLNSLGRTQKRATNPIAKLMLMREFDPEGKSMDVPDPYFGGKDGFQEVFEILDRSCANLLTYIQNNH